MSGLTRVLRWGSAAVLAGGLFLVGGLHWVGHIDADEAVARYREAASEHGHAPAARGMPATGVYRYRTEGAERTSFLRYARRYSRETVRIVTRRGCGVREEQWFLVQHREYYDRCGARLVGYGTDIAYWWTHGTQDFRCRGGSFDGTGLGAGQRVTWHCGDEDTTADQTTELVGEEPVTVAGRKVMARHTRWVTDFRGATIGQAVVDDWFDPETGLVLTEHREMGMQVGSPFVGRLTYTDRSSFTLLSFRPQR